MLPEEALDKQNSCTKEKNNNMVIEDVRWLCVYIYYIYIYIYVCVCVFTCVCLYIRMCICAREWENKRKRYTFITSYMIYILNADVFDIVLFIE